jgi:hypothetical protein
MKERSEVVDYKEIADGLFDEYQNKLHDEVIEKMCREIVKPLCDDRGWRFMAGMGTWFFVTLDGENVSSADLPDDEEFQRVCKILCFDVPGDPYSDFGDCINDYTPRNRRK